MTDPAAPAPGFTAVPARHPSAGRLAVAAACAILAAALLTGCESAPPPDVPPRAEADTLALTLEANFKDGKHTYFELAPDGTLSFAGGRDAVQHVIKPIGTLTPEQGRQLRDIAVKFNLLAAPHSYFDDEQTVVYRVKLDLPGLGSHGFRCVDQTVPGVKELHDALFKMNADLKYRYIFP